MKNTSGPVRTFPLAEAVRREFAARQRGELPDFSDTERTFRHVSDRQLRGTRRLFRLMGQSWLTRFMGSVGVQAVNWHLPGARWMVENTVYRQFVGGGSLSEAKATIHRLAERGVDSILDYGAEGKTDAAGMNAAQAESLRATEFAGEVPAVIGSVVKLTSLFPYEVLARFNDRPIDFADLRDPDLKRGMDRLNAICSLGRERRCEVYLDAEESWIQDSIDRIAEHMMERYNREEAVVLTTCQLYRHDRLSYLKALHLRARQRGFRLGVKLVRGAYMVKENKRAKENGYPSPIQPDLEATHRDFDAAVAYCIEQRQSITCCIASHNENSLTMALQDMQRLNIPTNHPAIRFSQLLGMSDNLTFNLAEGGYNVSKYMVYGPVREVLPYLVRRAQENTSVTGEAGRELNLLDREIARRSGAAPAVVLPHHTPDGDK
jgi:proline dehydrogenase